MLKLSDYPNYRNKNFSVPPIIHYNGGSLHAEWAMLMRMSGNFGDNDIKGIELQKNRYPSF